MLSRVFSVDSEQKKKVTLRYQTTYTADVKRDMCALVITTLFIVRRLTFSWTFWVVRGYFWRTRGVTAGCVIHSFIHLCSMEEWRVSSEIHIRFNSYCVYKLITFAFRSPAFARAPPSSPHVHIWNGDAASHSHRARSGKAVLGCHHLHSATAPCGDCCSQFVAAAGAELHCSCFSRQDLWSDQRCSSGRPPQAGSRCQSCMW